MTRIIFACLAAALLIAASDASAATNASGSSAAPSPAAASEKAIRENTDASVIRAQQQQIRAEVTEGTGRYKDMDTDQRDRLLHHQGLVLSRLEGVERTTDLLEADQIIVFNSLEAIEAIINSSEGGRMICRRHKPVGSNRPKTVCRTVDQMQAEKDAAEKSLERDQR